MRDLPKRVPCLDDLPHSRLIPTNGHESGRDAGEDRKEENDQRRVAKTEAECCCRQGPRRHAAGWLTRETNPHMLVGMVAMHLREQAQKTGEEDGENVVILGLGPQLDRDWLNSVFFHSQIKQLLVPFRVLLSFDMVHLAFLEMKQGRDAMALLRVRDLALQISDLCLLFLVG